MANLKIYYQNVRGLRTKCTEFYNNILNNDYSIIALTETWLYDDILDSEICDSRYDVFRFDRRLEMTGKTTGGGVAICFDQTLGAYTRDEFTCPPTELLWVTVPGHRIKIRKNLHICCAYIPENRLQSQSIMNYLSLVTTAMENNVDDLFLLLGDFNLRNIKWKLSGATFIKRGSVDVQETGHKLVDD